jgi:AcrR family transcriptional regulator
MARSSATAVAAKPAAGRPGPPGPPARPSRRELLLDAAAQILAEGHADEVTIETVATRAGVSRALVYKHFAHRQELLGVLYEQESSLLHRQLSAAVQECDRLEDMLRALVEGALSAQATRSATFVALVAEGARPAGQRARQRRRDGRTLRYFTDQVVRELGIDRDLAEAAMRMALGGIASVLETWRLQPKGETATSLSEMYVSMVMGGLQVLASGTSRPAGSGPPLRDSAPISRPLHQSGVSPR